MGTSIVSFSSVSGQIAELRESLINAVALSSGSEQMSYGQLDSSANKFASYLAHVGVSQGDTVAICMERSFDWIVAALGTIRAGAVYVPLDRAWPEERLRYAVDDCDAKVVVARAELLDKFLLDAIGIDPSRDAALIANVTLRTFSPNDPDSLAYVIYTSGSTGVPKGVEITHANLADLAQWHRVAFGVTPKDRASHLAGLGFDAAAWELWGTLTAGATLCLAGDALRASPELLHQWIIEEQITICFVPTVHAMPLMYMAWSAETNLRFLLTGGEALHSAPPRGLPFTVVNNYGPTESTVVATSCVLTPGSKETPPIGRPRPGTVLYLLDDAGQPVPDGETGEIYIAGNGLGRGYRNLPDITTKNFVPNPFSETPGSRMYRTGDRGMRRPDGDIEFRGRLDRQTKIRGHRIELDEIGNVLEHHPDLAFATAVTRTSVGGENQLVAYVLPQKGVSIPPILDLQEHLLRSLPEYMIPAIFVKLRDLPLSANGKIDLTLLPPPSDSNLLKRSEAKLPATATEEKLLGIMRELLEQSEITLEDNFFLAGGHSLLGVQLVMRLRSTMGVDLSLRQLFEAPTVEQLARTVDKRLAEDKLVAIWKELGLRETGLDKNFFEVGGSAQMLELLQQRIFETFDKNIAAAELAENPTIRKQAGLIHSTVITTPALPPGVLPLRTKGKSKAIFWVHYLSANLARAMSDDQAFIHIALASEDIDSLGKSPSLQRIAACFVEKVRATQPDGGYIIGGYCLGGILAYEISFQLRNSGSEVPLLVLLDTPSPSYFESPNALTPKLRNPRYLMKRLAAVGFKSAVGKLRTRFVTPVSRALKIQPPMTETEVVQELIERAAASYEPQKYEGRMTLILAADHPPHIDFLSEWQQLVPNSLHSQYMSAHHSELMSGTMVQTVADAMASEIRFTANETSAASASSKAPAQGSNAQEVLAGRS